jgi:hypothetical protein
LRGSRPQRTLEQARTEVGAVYARMQRDHKEAYNPNEHYRVAVIPFKEVLGERARMTLWLLMVAAAFVMIISAANVVNLTLMRGVREDTSSSCARRSAPVVARLRRLLLVENLILTLTGAAFGVLIALGGVRLWSRWRPAIPLARTRFVSMPRSSASRSSLSVVDRAAAVVRGVAATRREHRGAHFRRRAPPNGWREETASPARDWSWRRSRCPWCCWRARDCSRAR